QVATEVGATPRRRIPEATVARLPLYYRALVETGERQVPTISSERLAELAGVNAAKVRKDLSYLGSYGTRGVGYDVEYLLHEISRELGLTRDWPVAIVGVGILGRAPAVCTVPDGVSMRKVDLAIELQILSFYQLRRGAGAPQRAELRD